MAGGYRMDNICRYFQQGNCRYGQYCRYEHVSNYGRYNKVNYNEDEIIAAGVAEEVLNAERGGQWLLSCFGPFSQGPCIPGMEDVSPEEVRWEMYQAEKTGMVQQAKLHFQQLCQDMKTKRDALKNPNRETITMLKQLESSTSKGMAAANTAAKSSNFSFATPRLGNHGSASSTNVFANKSFGTQGNPFSGGFATSPPTSNSMFGRSNTNANPVFGGTATFGNNMGAFGGTTSTSSVFGANTNTQAFGSVASQSSSVFSSTAQPVFGQANVFGATAQTTNNVFARPQTSQTATSVFDNGATSTNPLFSGAMTSQASPALFVGSKTTTTGMFAGSDQQQPTSSVFGTPATSGSFNSGIFSQPNSLPAFGGAPVFGSTSTFTSTPNCMFTGATSTGGNIFGASSTSTASFGSVSQAGSTFGATATSSAPNVFGRPSGPVMSSSTASPFGTVPPSTAAASPFVTSAPQFDSTTTTPSVFSKPVFGSTFGGTGTSSAPFNSSSASGQTFGNTTTTTTAPFGGSGFRDSENSPFASTNTTTTCTTANPFTPRVQQDNNSPFGNVGQNQGNNTVTVSTNGPFGKSPFGSTVMSAVVDDSVYSTEGLLTDDEKKMYLAEKFVFGKIPLNPPSKDIR